jgi:MFS family permease
MLGGAGFLGIFSSTISKSPVLPLFAAHLGAGPAEVGAVAAVSAFTGVLLSLPAGLLSDRLGRRTLLLLAALVFASAPVLYLLVSRVWQLGLVRFYHGLATAVFVPVALALVGDLFPAARGEKMGWFSTATLLGRFLAPLAGGGLLTWFALDPAAGYRAVYLLCGLTGLGVLGLALALPRAAETGGQALPWAQVRAGLRLIVSDRRILATCATEAGVLFAYGTFEVFLPLYAVSIGLGAWQIGVFLASQVITLALTKPMLGRFSDRHGRPPQILAGCLCGALGIALFPWLASFAALLLLSIWFGLGLSVVTSASSALVADLSHDQGRGSAMGLLGSIMDIGHSSGPLLGGLAAAWLGLASPFWLAAGVIGLCALIFSWVMRRGWSGPA